MREQYNAGRTGPPQSYHELIGQVERFRYSGGEGGCFMEVLRGIESKAAFALQFQQQGQIDDDKLTEVFPDFVD